MLGGTYTFRTGLINNSVADFNQAAGVDAEYKINRHLTAEAEIAGSRRDRDWLTNDSIKTDMEGYAYKAALNADFDHKLQGHTNLQLSYTQMDRNFTPNLSND